jgi:capsular polysaccharide biosynthesis protein
VPGGYSPRPLIYAAMAAGAGLLLGGAVALILEGRARGWRDVRDAELTLKVAVLGSIPDYSPERTEG